VRAEKEKADKFGVALGNLIFENDSSLKVSEFGLLYSFSIESSTKGVQSTLYNVHALLVFCV
jgi:hypothetical protein